MCSAKGHVRSTPRKRTCAVQLGMSALCQKTAMTMPTMRPASKTLRKTMINAASTSTSRWRKLFRDQCPPSFRMEVVKEFVTSGSQRSNSDDAFAISRHDFFYPQAYTFEFHRGCIEVLHAKLNRHICRCMDFSRLEPMIFDADGHTRTLLRSHRQTRNRG